MNVNKGIQKGFRPNQVYILDKVITPSSSQEVLDTMPVVGNFPTEFALGTDSYRAFLISRSPIQIALYRRESESIEECRDKGEKGLAELINRLEENIDFDHAT